MCFFYSICSWKKNLISPSQGCFLQDPEACNTISPYFLKGFLAPSTINPSVRNCPCTFRFKLKRTDPHAHTRFVPIMPMMEKIWENQGGCRESRWMCCCVASCYLVLPSHYAWFLVFYVDKDSLEKQRYLCRDANSENAQR